MKNGKEKPRLGQSPGCLPLPACPPHVPAGRPGVRRIPSRPPCSSFPAAGQGEGEVERRPRTEREEYRVHLVARPSGIPSVQPFQISMQLGEPMELRRGKGRMTKNKKKNPRPSLFFSACHEASDQPRPSAIPRVQRAVPLTPPPSPSFAAHSTRSLLLLGSGKASHCHHHYHVLGLYLSFQILWAGEKDQKCQQICTIATIGVMRQEERSAASMPRALPFARRPVFLTLAKALLHTIHVYIPSRFENTSSCNVHETRLRDGVRTGLGEITQVCISNTLPRPRGYQGEKAAGGLDR